ncbi:amino acid aminotransferase [Actinobacillus pleuropneumoniae]|uniref:Aminotransferase n=1 Tax=Actinobacillus pleuropneumoniae serotype 3 (strain JL03) TaxID=434271 RepID=B0BNT6_ACTPJ|nr:amino acid aminotransferase [Actinobacillus pleuropneumoniae]ABY69221.1 aspartate aminotransferase [Actinobacillus pleuropneumoniae serovar 3 str. JL03]EFM96635.1 Aspartate aminotransferase [Actinobacillus pleuropneumoniae serovar 10 str. D13039]UKH14192.1 aspartate/tyrosine/aromatic aminotransferase [Actinobacillus pleuropneumoniae]UKH18215.1 aspartate/tyrosine/aromatic aminotransferase [Actinobacillus pleuropneumoniae]UKH22364.1 aspartate/tyrosine/aromatic aminotransferase [Actinobacillus
MSMFNHIQAAPADPILGLGEAFKAEQRAGKINLGIGVYMNAEGKTPIVKAVKKAEALLLEQETNKNYLTIDGVQAFNAYTQELLFGKGAEIIASGRAKTAQSLGGTGALRIAAEFIKRQTSAKNIWISNPTWPNHNAIAEAVGLNVKGYRYYNPETHGLDWDNLLADLSQAEAGDVVLLHGCCHNPTGIDPTPEQWDALAKLSAEKGWLPLFDFAYQGFGNGLDQDAYGLRAFVKNHKELLIASSYSKNFGLYNERVGAFTLVAENADVANKAFTQIKSIIRVLYSNPAAHGANAVARVLGDEALRAEWVAELDEMRDRIKGMRNRMVQLLKEKGAKQDFDFIAKQNGMFSFSSLTPEQVDRLREEFAIYAVRSGRINVAGITDQNIGALCEAIVKVL